MHFSQHCRPAAALLSILLALGAVALVAEGAAAAETNPRIEYVRNHYTKMEVRIPMRDGVSLFTAVYVPNDRSRSYPFLMTRTPYSVGPYGPDRYRWTLGPTEAWEKEGFIFVFQDVRGRFMSEGEFVNMRPHIADKSSREDVDESTDTYDTIEWLLANVEGHNGKVGQWGNSYPGFYTSAGAIDSHPALAAISPQAPIADWWWDDMHRNGAFNVVLAFNFFSRFGVIREDLHTDWPERLDMGTPDGYQFFLDLGPLKNVNEKYFHGEIPFWNETAAHPNYDEFWQSRNIIPHLENIGAASLVVGDWFDTEDLYGPLATYRSIEDKNPGIVNHLVMGPWPHGGHNRPPGDSLGIADFGSATAEYFQTEIVMPFFLHYLKDGPRPDLAEATVFETGANRWRHLPSWPPAGAEKKKLYLGEGGALGFAEHEGAEAGADAHDAFVSDPAKPVPYTMEITSRWARRYMTEDQRFAAWRPDVLVYRSEPLEEDLTLAGPVLANLFVSTTGSDADWIVKVIDELPGEVPGWDADSGDPNPGGRQMLVRAEAFRGRFRESFEKPVPFVPGEVAEVSFKLHDFFHTFKRGHRLMVQIQSSWFPFIDRNPQTFVPNIFEADEDDFVAATHRVHRSAEHPSYLEIGVLEEHPRSAGER